MPSAARLLVSRVALFLRLVVVVNVSRIVPLRVIALVTPLFLPLFLSLSPVRAFVARASSVVCELSRHVNWPFYGAARPCSA